MYKTLTANRWVIHLHNNSQKWLNKETAPTNIVTRTSRIKLCYRSFLPHLSKHRTKIQTHVLVELLENASLRAQLGDIKKLTTSVTGHQHK